ncbi:MAG: GNAT family N-acetyltransferase [Proteobacteria bacterium]|nr:GNAT family N-acetyltransferase [Pseudomonadota bacterium]
MVLRFELLSEDHNRLDFDCGEEALNLYIRHFARQDMRRDLARTFVVRQKEDFKVMGYYTLCSGSIDVKELPERLLKKLPKYPLPVARLARLAVDKKQQAQGYGELLLMDALYRTSVARENMGIYGMIIDAKHEKAKQFYQRYGFQSVFLNPLLLFAPLADLLDKFEITLQ